MLLLTQCRLNSCDCFTGNSHLLIFTQILIYTIYNTLCCSNVVVHRFIRKALHSLTVASLIRTFSVNIEITAIVFNMVVFVLNIMKIPTQRESTHEHVHSSPSNKKRELTPVRYKDTSFRSQPSRCEDIFASETTVSVPRLDL